MSGIYLHIPFCRHKCPYCNFFSLASVRRHEEFSRAMLSEIAQRSHEAQGHEIHSVYFGGGTPSYLSPGLLGPIMQSLHLHFHLHAGAEITLEANPEDVNPQSLTAWHQMGINRLSLGIQSFQPQALEYLGRACSSGQNHRAIGLALSAGFSQISLDLIYGWPGQTTGQWIADLQMAVDTGAQHISAYMLGVEPRTTLHHQIHNGIRPAPADEDAARLFQITSEYLLGLGWEHYEISNFCQPGWYARHNTAYWSRKPYLGLGPSAHSFDGQVRRWNIAQLDKYIASTLQGNTQHESETLTPADEWNELLMTSLRTHWGCPISGLEQIGGAARAKQILSDASKYFDSGWLQLSEGCLVVTHAGKLFTDAIASELFWC